MNFPITRKLIARLPSWVDHFASLLPEPIRVPVGSSFRWEHPDKNAEALQVAKAVRAVSGMRSALVLADARQTVEAGSILRMVSDFATEIEYLGEGLLEGRFTTDQEEFIEQNYATLPPTIDDLAAEEKRRIIGRKAMAKAFDRIADKSGADKELLKKLTAYLNRGYDGLVHGHYPSAMELFTGRSMKFMMEGHESARHVCMAKVGVAGKLKEVLNALRFMAITRGLSELDAELSDAFAELDQSGEDTGRTCDGLA